MEVLKGKTGDNEDKKKMMEILKKMQEEEADGEALSEGNEEEEELDLHERFEGIDLSQLSVLCELYTLCLSSFVCKYVHVRMQLSNLSM